MLGRLLVHRVPLQAGLLRAAAVKPFRAVRLPLMPVQQLHAFRSSNRDGPFLGKKTLPKMTMAELKAMLAKQEEELGHRHADTLRTLHEMAYRYYNKKDMARSLKINQEIYEALLAKHGATHWRTISALRRVIFGLERVGQLEEALASCNALKQLEMDFMVRSHRGRTITSINRLMKALERPYDLTARLNELDACYVKEFGPSGKATRATRLQIIEALSNSGQYEIALPFAECLAADLKESEAPTFAQRIFADAALATCQNKTGQTDLAIPLLQDVVERARASLGTDSATTRFNTLELSKMLIATSRFEEAITLETDYQALCQDRSTQYESKQRVAYILERLHKYEEALALNTDVLNYVLANRPGYQSRIDVLSVRCACNLLSLGRKQEALEEFTKVLALRTKMLRPDHPKTLYVMELTANALEALGRQEEATGLLAKMYALKANAKK